MRSLSNLSKNNALICAVVLATSCEGVFADSDHKAAAYRRTDLVADQDNAAKNKDTNLVNAWGIAFNPNGPVWVVNNGTDTSTLYDGSGTSALPPAPPFVKTPPGPTGIVFNGFPTFNFPLNADPATQQPAVFIFATEGGAIAAWNPKIPNVPNVTSTETTVVVDNSAKQSIYKGLAMGANGSGRFLYATDFHNGRVDVFDETFKPVALTNTEKPNCTFSDPRIPDGFAPFGIQNVNGDIYVTYAQQDADKEDDVKGPHLGVVNVFDADGCLVRRFATGGRLNAPWGIALAPASFGGNGNRLLVGNFGDGRINAYSVDDGSFQGALRDEQGKKISIDGLWGIAFGNGVKGQPTNTLFFTAGPDEENHGLYGKIETLSVSRHGNGHGDDNGDDHGGDNHGTDHGNNQNNDHHGKDHGHGHKNGGKDN